MANDKLNERENAWLISQLRGGADPRKVVIPKNLADPDDDPDVRDEEEKGPNKTESRYMTHLEQLKAAGRVKWYCFNKVKIKIAKKCWFTIDFFVVYSNGRTEAVDVKGRKGDGFYAREDSIVKIKAAAVLFPIWDFAIVWPAKGGLWSRKWFDNS